MAAIHTPESTFILRFRRDETPDGEVVGNFEVVQEVDPGRFGVWYKSAYLYVAGNKLRILIGGEVRTQSFVSPALFLLRYIPSLHCLFFVDSRVIFPPSAEF